MKLSKLYLGIVALVAIGGGAGFYYHHSATPAYHCLAGPGEECANPEWYAEWREFDALNKKYAPPADVQKRLQEMNALLAVTVPKGYKPADWNVQKEKFIKPIEPMPTLANPVPAAPAK